VIAAPDLDRGCLSTTDGEIAVINLESARRRSWSRFFADPRRDGVAETVGFKAVEKQPGAAATGFGVLVLAPAGDAANP